MANDAQHEIAELERRLANTEAELQRTKSTLADLDQHYSTVPVGLCLIDTDLRYVRVNHRLAEINGATVEEHLGRYIGDIVPQIIDIIEPIYRKVLETGEPVLQLEISADAPFNPDVESTFLASYHPVTRPDGSIWGVGTVIQDVTALKQAELAQKESEQRLRATFDTAPEAIVVFDVDTGKFVDWNDNALQLFRINRNAISIIGPNDLSPPTQPDGRPSAEAARALIEQALSGETPIFEWIHLDSKGDEIPCEIRLAHMPMSGRRLVRGSITDISERHRAEQALKNAHDALEDRVARRTAELEKSAAELERSEERWRSLINTAPDLILTIGPDGTIQYINQVGDGGTPNDVIGSCAYDYIAPEYRQTMVDAVETVMTTGEIVNIEIVGIAPDGQGEWYQSRIGPFREEGKIVAVTSIATVISERKVSEKKLLAEQQLLRKLLALQENERRMVAHDIHDGFVQYVVGAQMCMQAIPHREGKDGEPSPIDRVDTYLQQAISEGRRLIRDLRPMVLDEAGIVESLTHLIADEEKNNRMTIAFDHDVQFERLEPMLEGAIFRIVQESLNNVKQHGQVHHAGVQLLQDHDLLQIAIRDRGVGFDRDNIVSDRFGLQGIAERARLFGGHATIESAPGKGTSILVTLPIDFTPQLDETPDTGDER